MGWFHDVKNPKLKSVKKASNHAPVGLWKKCQQCGSILQTEKLEANFQVCPQCDYHYRLTSFERISLMTDEFSFIEEEKDLKTKDPLIFKDKLPYKDRLKQAYEVTGLNDSTLCGTAKINGLDVSMAVMDFRFMGGSMGVVTGEKIALAFDRGFEKKIPVIVVSCSGGARMQEGILSLMQMGKTAASRHRLREAGIPYISILTDPTTGGCAASFALFGDIHLAEPKALIGFAGPRVIEQSIRQTLPSGFQRSEFLSEHGFIDRIVHRKSLKDELTYLLKFLYY